MAEAYAATLFVGFQARMKEALASTVPADADPKEVGPAVAFAVIDQVRG